MFEREDHMLVHLDLLSWAAQYYLSGSVLHRAEEKKSLHLRLPSSYKNREAYTVVCVWDPKEESLVFLTGFPEHFISASRVQDCTDWIETMLRIHSSLEDVHSNVLCLGGEVEARGRGKQQVYILYSLLQWIKPPQDRRDIRDHLLTLKQVVREADQLLPMVESFHGRYFNGQDPNTTKPLVRFSYFEQRMSS